MHTFPCGFFTILAYFVYFDLFIYNRYKSIFEGTFALVLTHRPIKCKQTVLLVVSEGL
jgi:hypothetical protein